jgi:hypothetical protein
MKKLLVLLFIISRTFTVSSQTYLTTGQVYNFNVGDVFETESGNTDEPTVPPIYGLTIILAKWYSAHSDTVFYKDSLVSYTPPVCPPPCLGSFHTDIVTFSYTNLSSMANQQTGSSPCPITLDTIYYDTAYPYCNRKVWEEGPSVICIDTTQEYAMSAHSLLVEGCGGPYYTLYTFDFTNDIPYTDYCNLIYYKKNDTICGSEYVITGINQINEAKADFKVYPNPSNGKFTFSYSNPGLVSGSQILEVYNVLGEKVYRSALNQHDYEINLSAQPNGVYLYRVIAEDGSLAGEGKLVIQK